MDEEYKKQQQIYNAELDRLNELLTMLDPESDAYQKTADAIKKIQEAKLLEEKAHSERRSSMVPDWAPKLLSVAATTGLCIMIYRGEVSGKVIGSAATSMLNKLKF